MIEAPARHFPPRATAEPGPLELVGLTEAGAVLGVSRQRVYQLVTEGRSPEPAARLRGGVLWTPEVVECWAEERAKRRAAAACEEGSDAADER